MENKIYKLSPSDFAFLYEGCKRCFYLKVVYGIRQPTTPMPGIFSKMSWLLRDHYNEKRTEQLNKNIPPGKIVHQEKFVTSKPIASAIENVKCFINGKFDVVVEFDDGSYGIIDFKTGNPKDEYAPLYGRQLHAYSYALENPEDRALSLSPITKLGLLYFHPQRTIQKEDEVEKLLYEADVEWKEIPINHDNFLSFINELSSVLSLDEPPQPSDACPWCQYRNKLVGLAKLFSAKTKT